jgi:hypothetical protein
MGVAVEFWDSGLVSLAGARYEAAMGVWSGRRSSIGGGGVAFAALAGLMAISTMAQAQDATLPATGDPQPAADAAPAACTKTDFETVVDQSAAALRDLNIQNRPRFQEKLRALRTKKAWSEDQFLKEAVPYVKDDEIDAYDRTTSELLNKIASMGDEGTASATPDCGLYQVLRGHMTQLVDTQNAKWAYMFRKIDAALGQ